MINDALALEGFQLCEGNGNCDFCHQDIPEGEYFWRRTSYEYVEGDYACRACAGAWIAKQQALYDSYEASRRVVFAIAAHNAVMGRRYWRRSFIEGGEEIDREHDFYNLAEIRVMFLKAMQDWGVQPAMQYYLCEDWEVRRVADIVLSQDDN